MRYKQHESPRSCNNTIYLSRLPHSEDVLEGKCHTGEHEKLCFCNVRKHRDIKNGDQYIAMDISLKSGGLENMKTKYSDPKYYLGISGKGLISSMGIKAIRRSTNAKRKSLTFMKSALRIFLRLLSYLRMYLMRVMLGRGPNTCLLTVISSKKDCKVYDE